MNSDELQQHLQFHRDWLSSDGISGKRIDLSNHDLSNAHLSGEDFRRAIFIGTKFTGANLGGTDFSRAQLHRADLRSCKLGASTFRDADLSHALLSEAGMTGTDLSGSNLIRTDFGGATLLSLREPQRTNFVGCSFSQSREKVLIDKHTVDRLDAGSAAVICEHANVIDVEVGEDGLSAIFAFPEEHRTACEQYLMYFGEFLEQLDVSSDLSLSRLRGETILSIAPRGRDEALILIQEALAAYLAYPSQEGNESDSRCVLPSQQTIAMHHLRSECHLLRSKLESKQAELDATRIALSAVREAAEYRSEEFLRNIMLLSVRHVNSGKKTVDARNFLSDVIKLGPVNLGGLEIDLGLLASRVYELLPFRSKKDQEYDGKIQRVLELESESEGHAEPDFNNEVQR